MTSLCWRPDGKVLACGYEDGFISLLDVENGETMQRGKMVAGVSTDHRLASLPGSRTCLLSSCFQVLHLQLAG